MTIDERLEALTQTVELMAGMHRDNEKRYEALFEQNEARLQQNEARLQQDEARFQQNEARLQQDEARFAQVTRNFEVVLDSIRGLENVARAHEQRIGDLEDRAG